MAESARAGQPGKPARGGGQGGQGGQGGAGTPGGAGGPGGPGGSGGPGGTLLYNLSSGHLTPAERILFILTAWLISIVCGSYVLNGFSWP